MGKSGTKGRMAGLLRQLRRRLWGKPVAPPKRRPGLKGLPCGGQTITGRTTVLLITHNASRSGAPMVALDIGRRLSRDVNLVTVALEGGELLPWFQQDATALYTGQRRPKPGAVDRLIGQVVQRHKPAAVVINSMASRAAFAKLRAANLPVLLLSHEMASRLANPNEIKDVAAWVRRVILSSPLAAAEAFGDQTAVWPQNHRILPQGKCAVPPLDMDPAAQADDAARLTAQMQGPPGRITVMGMGSLAGGKGCDLFLEMARQVQTASNRPDVAFFWFGRASSKASDSYVNLLQIQAAQAGLHFEQIFVGTTGLPDLAQSLSDIFVLPSRLDTLPNVAIDAMLAGHPVVCFDRASGIAPLIAAAGQAESCLAPPLDTGILAARVLELLRNPNLRQAVGAALQAQAAPLFDRDRYLDAIATEVQALL